MGYASHVSVNRYSIGIFRTEMWHASIVHCLDNINVEAPGQHGERSNNRLKPRKVERYRLGRTFRPATAGRFVDLTPATSGRSRLSADLCHSIVHIPDQRRNGKGWGDETGRC